MARPGVPVGTTVAIKVLDRQFSDERTLQRLRKKNERLQHLVHNNIVRYLDFFVHGDEDGDELGCIVTEFLSGRDLKTVIKEQGAKTRSGAPGGLPLDQVRAVLGDCLEGLAYACGHGVVHRDLTPSNIFITDDNVVKLLDFDIAHFDSAGDSQSTGGAKGKLDYMAPEILLAKPDPDYEQADVFSFGVCLYEAVTGALPCPTMEGGFPPYIARWMSQTPPEISYSNGIFRVYPGLSRSVKGCLDISRERRFRRFVEVSKTFKTIAPRTIHHPNGKIRYECVALAGRGGYADVFEGRCIDEASGRVTRKVAIKYLRSDKDCPERFVREATILAQHPHDHLVEYIDFLRVPKADDRSSYYLIMEFLPGIPEYTLRGRIAEAKRANADLPVEEIILLFQEYLEALDHLHKKSIFHRDIKPNNLYAPPGHPEGAKVFDLGIARTEKGTVTSGGFLPGTPDYMAPELAARVNRKGEWTYESRGAPQSDLFSLTLCLYESICREHAFPRLTGPNAVIWQAFMERAKTPVPVSYAHSAFTRYPALKTIIEKGLKWSPSDRYDSAKKMLDALSKLIPKPQAAQEPTVDTEVDETKGMLTLPDGATLPPPDATKVYEPPKPSEPYKQPEPPTKPYVPPAPPVPVKPYEPPKPREPRKPLSRKAKTGLLVVAGVLVGAAVVLPLGVSFLKDDVTVSVEGTPEASKEWVDRLVNSNSRKDAAFLFDAAGKAAWQTRFDERRNAAPAEFSNAFLRVIAGADTNALATWMQEWDSTAALLKALDLPERDIDALTGWMQQTNSVVVAAAEEVRRKARAAEEAARAKTLAEESRLKALTEEARQKQLAEEDAARKKAAAEEARLKQLAEEEDARKKAAAEEARQKQLAQDAAARKKAAAEAAEESRKAAIAEEAARRAKLAGEEAARSAAASRKLVEDLINEAGSVSAVEQLKAWLAKCTDGQGRLVSKADRDAVMAKMIEKGRQLSGKYEQQATSAYAGDNKEAGDSAVLSLAAIAGETCYLADDLIKASLAAAKKAQQSQETARQTLERQRTETTAALVTLATRVAGGADVAGAIGDGAKTLASISPKVMADDRVKSKATLLSAACRDSLAAVIARSDDPEGRQARLTVIDGLLRERDVRSALGEDAVKLDKDLLAAKGVVLVSVANPSRFPAILRISEDSRKHEVPAGASRVLTVPLSREGRRTVVCDALPLGCYVSQTNQIAFRWGGGAALSIRPFEEAAVVSRLVLPAIDASEPPVRIAYRKKADEKWTDWPNSPVPLYSGEYEFRFTRDDFLGIQRDVRIPMGAGAFDVPVPRMAEWVPGVALKTLQDLSKLKEKKDWPAMAERFAANSDARLNWPRYSLQYQDLRVDCHRQITLEIAGKLPALDAEVQSYCSYLYQWDLAKGTLRRLADGSFVPSLAPVLPVYPAGAITNDVLRAQYLRLTVWQTEAKGLKSGAGLAALAKSLDRLAGQLESWAPAVADRCRFESALLQWDYSTPAPADLKTTQRDAIRWQAHSVFRRGEPQPEVLILLASYGRRGGRVDRQDVILAMNEAAYCWGNYIQSVLDKEKEGYVVEAKGSVFDPKRAREEALRSHRDATRKVSESLLAVMSAAKEGVAAEVADYFKAQSQDAQLSLVGKVVGELDVFKATSFQTPLRKFNGSAGKAEFEVISDLLKP